MIDILLISGFLGSGKTSLMKSLIKNFKKEKIGIIVNEFGQEGVDGKLLKESGLSVDEISDGSIFCACRSDRFIDAILKTKTFVLIHVFCKIKKKIFQKLKIFIFFCS